MAEDVAQYERDLRAAALPEGWKEVESESRPGTQMWQNVHTDECIGWFPSDPASAIEGESPDLQPPTVHDDDNEDDDDFDDVPPPPDEEEEDAADWRTWYTGDSEARDDPDEDLATLRREVEAMTRLLDEPSLSESDRWTAKKNLAKKKAAVRREEELAVKRQNEGLPQGWQADESQSRPGTWSYLNVATGEDPVAPKEGR